MCTRALLKYLFILTLAIVTICPIISSLAESIDTTTPDLAINDINTDMTNQNSLNLGADFWISAIATVVNIALLVSNIAINAKNNQTSRDINNASISLQKTGLSIQSDDLAKSRVSTYISDKRTEWIQRTKDLIAEYLYSVDEFVSCLDKRIEGQINVIKRNTNRIRLQLNYSGVPDREILFALYELNKRLEILDMLRIGGLNRHKNDKNEFVLSREEMRMVCAVYVVYDKLISSALDKKPPKRTDGDIKEEVIRFLGSLYLYIGMCENEIITCSEAYMKVEWERIKREVKDGIDPDYDTNAMYSARKSVYKN